MAGDRFATTAPHVTGCVAAIQQYADHAGQIAAGFDRQAPPGLTPTARGRRVFMHNDQAELAALTPLSSDRNQFTASRP